MPNLRIETANFVSYFWKSKQDEYSNLGKWAAALYSTSYPRLGESQRISCCVKYKFVLPFFFSETTVAGMTYLNMLEQLLWPQLKEDMPPKFRVQQYEVSTRFHSVTRDSLDENLPEA
jgi:hypothetical protein